MALVALVLLSSGGAFGSPAREILRQRLLGPVAGAHQGGIFGPWPNTMEAFARAKADGADVIEMDLRITKDGVAVVFHDEDLKTWTDCRGKVRDRTLAELRDCRLVNAPDSIIPTFEDVLRWAQGTVVINAEFKDTEIIAPALELVKKYDAYAWTYFQTQRSRDKFNLAHALDPEVSLLYVLSDTDQDLAWALGQDSALLIIEVNKVTRSPEVIDAIHLNGRLVSEDSWHFSKTQELFCATCDAVFKNSIDIAISNRPKGCAEQRDEAKGMRSFLNESL